MTRHLVGLTVCGVMTWSALASAQTLSPVLAREQIVIAGVTLQASPEHQTVPRNIATSVTAQVVATGGSSGDASSAIPADAVVYAELRGPAFGAPVTIIAKPGEPLRIQPLAISGSYVLENIRLVSGGVTFLQATPDTVTIDVIDKVLVSQVTTRALTAREIQQKGIFVDQTNFDVVNFTAAFGIQGSQQTIDFPIVLPKRPSASLPASPPAPSLPPLAPAAVLPPPQALPQLQQVFQTSNVSISGLVLKIEDEDIDRQFSIPPIPGVIIIPGNIAFLHQFFSVLLMVSNVAPGGSSLVVRDATATVVLPPGADAVAGSDDDPLKMARTGNPPVEQAPTQPIAQPGPDGKLGTVDDVGALAPGDNGNAEFLVEGRKEGTHTVQIQIHAVLDGLPVGPVKISGFATGIVEVRNPTFSLTLSHPATVMAGDPYDLLVTVSNTSDSPANLVSVNLSPNSISGAVLQSDATVTLDTIAAHDAATATFHLVSQQTGNVTATSFTSDDAPGKFILRSSVGALGIPPSPNSLVLPPAADALPADLKLAGISLLGQAYALATSPVVPTGLKAITPQIVYERATNLTQAGQRLQMGDTLPRVAADLALDMLGNGFARIDERFAADPAGLQQTRADYQGFDTLFRQSQRGVAFLAAIAAALRMNLQSTGALAFQNDWAAADASRPPFISAITGSGSGGAPVVMRMIGPGGSQVGMASAGGPIVRDLAFTNFLTLVDTAPIFSQSIVDAVPAAGDYRIELNGTAAGTFDLGLVVPAGNHLRHVTFAGVPISAGARASLAFSVGGTSSLTLLIDDDRDGSADRAVTPAADEPVVDAGPTLVGAVQIVTGAPDPSQFGQVVGLLFSEEVSGAAEQLDTVAGPRYQVDANQVLGASLQPGGRVVLLSLRDGVGPFVGRTVTATGIADRLGHSMDPTTASAPIAMRISGTGGSIAGRVRAADGTPIHNARLQLSQQAPVGVPTGALAGLGDLAAMREVTVTVKDLDSTGRYSFDYVRQFGLSGEFVRLRAANMDTGETAEVVTHLGLPGRHMDVDIVFVGTGTLTGRAFAKDGTTPLAGAAIKVSSLTRIGQAFGAVTDASGAFSIAGIPAGNFTIEAAHVASNARTVQAGSIPAAGATVVQNLVLIPLADVVLVTGALKGQVFHASDGTPAAGVPVYTDRGGLATTDAAGGYRIDTLPAGPIVVKSIDQVRFEQGVSATTIVGGIDVVANLLLVGGTGTVRGVVVSSTGQAVPNAVVGGGVALVRTDAGGAFELDDVPIGQRTISALDEATGTTASATANLLSAGETANVRIVLPGQGSIAGRVFEADGRTLMSNIKVFLLGGNNSVAVTDANGGYRFDGLALGAYKVSAFRDDFSDGNVADTKIVFQGEVHVTNIVARGKGRVTGIVLAADGATPLGARVGFSEVQVAMGTLAPLDNPSCLGDIQVGDSVIEMPKCQTVGIGFTSTPLTRVVNNDVSSGTFTFEDVFVGGFTVEAANAFSPAVMRAAGAIAKAGDTAAVVLKLSATSRVKGTVYKPDGITPAGRSVVVTFGSSTLSNVNVVTDDNGAYLYPLVNPGGFSVTASDPVSGLVGHSDGTVDAGATANVAIRLLATGTVRVFVTGSNGVVAGALVTVTRGTFPNDSRQGVTGADGSVMFSGGDAITEGVISVSAFDPATGITGYASGTVSPAGETDVNVRLNDETGTVHGRFFMPDGVTTIPNAQVHVTSARGQAFATTDTGGNFTFDGVFGSVTLEAFDPVTARRGRSGGVVSFNHQDVPVDIVAVAQGTVKGVVRLSNDGSPVAAADVSLSITSAFGGQLATSTGVDGSFTFPGVSAGGLTISAHDAATGLGGTAAASLAVEGEIVNVDVVMQVPALGRVQGTVRRADGSAAIGAQVVLGSGARTSVDDSGFYAIDGVPVGHVTVNASAPVGPMGNDGGVGGGDLKFAGDSTTIDVTFIGTGVVTSTVRSSTGTPVPFALVTLTSRSTIRTFSLTANTDSQGQVRFSGIPVGDVSLTAVDSATALAGSASGRLPTDAATLDVAITLQPAGSLRAHVLRQDRTTPAAGLAVELAGQAQRFGSTASDGSLGFDNLPLGQYRLNVTDPLGTGIVKANASIGQAGQLVDLGALVLDEAAPAVQRIVPAAGASGVPVNQQVQVLFSEAVDPSTVTGDTIRVTTSAGVVAGTWSLDTNNTTATFAPAVPFRDFAQVAVRVTTGVTDLVGKPLPAETAATFTTADSTPPVVVSRAPAPAARDVASNAVIRVAFSEGVDPGRFTGPAVSLTLSNAAVDGRIDFVLGNTAVVFTPSSPLAPNSTYRVVIQPAADVFGNVAAGSSYTFSTTDTIAPSIDALTSSGGGHVKAGGTATVTVSASATDVALVELLVNGAVIQSRASGPFTFPVAATAALSPSFTIGARATDLSGNVGDVRSIQLIVDPDLAPEVAITAPANGATVNSGAHVVVSVHATDDLGVAQVGFQAVGAVTTSSSLSVNPASPSKDATFAIDVPVDAVGGSKIDLKVAAIDTIGQSSATTSISVFVADVTPPVVHVLSPAAGDAIVPGQSLAVTIQADDSGGVAAISLQTTGAASFSEVRAIAPGQTTTQAVFLVPVPATARPTDRITIIASAVDASGNAAAPVSVNSFIQDITAPATTLAVSGATAVQPGRTISFSISATDDGGVARIAYEASGAFTAALAQTISPAQSAASGQFSLTVPANAPVGSTLTLVGIATDASGNVGRSTAVVLAIVADQPPVVHLTSPSDGASVVEGAPLSITADASDDVGVVSVTFTINGSVVATRTSPPYSVQTAVPGGADGSPLIVRAIATDTAGQPAADAVALTLHVDATPPQVVAIVPADKSVDVSIATPIVVSFSEALDRASVTADSFRVSANGSSISGGLSFDGDATVRFTPSQLLPLDSAVVVELRSGITDRFGNALANSDGTPLSGPLTFTFATGTFAISKPAANQNVIEKSRLTLEAQGSSSLGIASVVFTVNGSVVPATGGPVYTAAFDVPARSTAPTLTIVARARNGAGAQIAVSQVTVTVGVGLTATPPIVGVPVGGTGQVRLMLTSALDRDLAVSFDAVDRSVVVLPPAPVLLQAGQTTLALPVGGAAIGNTTVFARSDQGTASFIASVSVPTPAQTLTPLASPVGLAVRPPPVVAQVFGPLASSVSITARVTATAASIDRTVTVTSSNDAVARVIGVPIVRANQRTAFFSIATGVEGTALLTVTVGSDVASLLVVVGSAGTGQAIAALAADTGISVARPATTGQLFTLPGGTRTIVVLLRATPLPVDTPVVVTSSNPSVVLVSGTPVVRAGERTASVTIVTDGAGVADLVFNVGGEVRDLVVSVGAPGSAPVPAIVARPVGVAVAAAPSAGRLVAGMGSQQTLGVRLRSQPATANTPVTASSSNPAVATVVAATNVPAGGQVSQITIQTGLSGEATLTITAGGEVRELTVVAGGNGNSATPPIVAPPAGVAIVPAPQTGVVIAPPNAAAAVGVRLLGAPAAADLVGTASSSNPNVAAVQGPVVVRAGERVAQISIATSGPGAAVITIEIGGQTVRFTVISGTAAPGDVPVIVAPVVGVQIQK